MRVKRVDVYVYIDLLQDEDCDEKLKGLCIKKIPRIHHSRPNPFSLLLRIPEEPHEDSVGGQGQARQYTTHVPSVLKRSFPKDSSIDHQHIRSIHHRDFFQDVLLEIPLIGISNNDC
jgi:hypothetical protein